MAATTKKRWPRAQVIALGQALRTRRPHGMPCIFGGLIATHDRHIRQSSARRTSSPGR
jgi:hypothetical protein